MENRLDGARVGERWQKIDAIIAEGDAMNAEADAINENRMQ